MFFKFFYVDKNLKILFKHNSKILKYVYKNLPIKTYKRDNESTRTSSIDF